MHLKNLKIAVAVVASLAAFHTVSAMSWGEGLSGARQGSAQDGHRGARTDPGRRPAKTSAMPRRSRRLA